MSKQQAQAAATLVVIFLAGCGSDGGGAVNSTPTPAVIAAPTPPPPPPPPPGPPPPPSGNIGLTSTEPFAVQAVSLEISNANIGSLELDESAQVEFRYIPADNAYEIKLPQYESGRLKTTGYSGGYTSNVWGTVSNSANTVLLGNTAATQPVNVILSWPSKPLNPYAIYTYTSWGKWSGTEPQGVFQRSGIFAYGIPTSTTDVPSSGAASYTAEVMGYAADGMPDLSAYVTGLAKLSFNFGTGTLSGSMRTTLCPWDCDTDLGEYKFKNTVFAVGSRTFSGAFDVPGTTLPSSFSGNFNGPAAIELMARWQAPY